MSKEEDIFALLKHNAGFVAFLEGEDMLHTFANSAFRRLPISEQEAFLIALCRACLTELEKLKEPGELSLEKERGPFN